MTPNREIATWNGYTYFVTSNTAGRMPYFLQERWANLFIEALYAHRLKRYLLHGFVLMPDHFHLLITPRVSLETAVQCLKSEFATRAEQGLGWTREIWVSGYTDLKVRNYLDFNVQLAYIADNPVEAGLVERPELYAYSSAHGSFELDAYPAGSKPGPPVWAKPHSENAPSLKEFE
jgi:putative transposase